MNVRFRSRGTSARGIAYTSSHAFNRRDNTLLALSGTEAGTKVHCRDEKRAKEIIRQRMKECIELDGDRLVGNVGHARIEKESM